MIPILAVDDVAANLHSLEVVLEDLPIQLDCVQSGQEGLGLLLEKDYALALIDVQMPGMNGFEMAELMRASPETQHIPIIFITAGSSKDIYVFRGYEVGAVDYIIKPYEPQILVGKVQVFMDLYRARRELQSALNREKQISEQLREANEDLGRFSAIAAHDLRSPLGKAQRLLTMVQMKFNKKYEDEKLSGEFERLVRILNDMNGLVESLYDLYSLSSHEIHRHQVLIKNVVEEASSLLQDQLDGTGANVVVGRIPAIRGEGRLLRQVFQNLIANAIKYRKESVAPEIEISLAGEHAETGDLLIEVSDNGVGFDAKAGTSIFAPFARLQETSDIKGLGIGLATVRKIVEIHGGEIHATGHLGEGATFTLRLPAWQDRSPGREES